MLDRVPPEQRRLVFLSMAALALAVGFVVFALIFAAGRAPETPEEYEPFEAGSAARLSELIATQQPIFYPDPTGGDRGFFLTLLEGNFTALHVVPPGKTRSCPIEWRHDEERFEDCDGTMWAPRELRRFPLSIRDGIVVVDLRRLRAPRSPSSPSTTHEPVPQSRAARHPPGTRAPNGHSDSSCSRSTCLATLPVPVRGNSSTKITRAGTL